MQLPNTLYVVEDQHRIHAFRSRPIPEAVPYIMKDALIEWLEHIKQYDPEVAIDSIIGKINVLAP